MQRHCDGKDPNLIMYVATKAMAESAAFKGKVQEGERLLAHIPMKEEFIERKPCDCGFVFNDVQNLVIWPHGLV